MQTGSLSPINLRANLRDLFLTRLRIGNTRAEEQAPIVTIF